MKLCIVATINSCLHLVKLVDYVDLPRTSSEALELGIFNNIADEDTELLDEDLLDLVAAGQS